MMNHDITAVVGKHKTKRRRGRGAGSGCGKTAGRGHKGQSSRAGASQLITFEGGQMPLFRRIPKRGFNNVNFATKYAIVNVDQLQQFDEGTRIDPQMLIDAGLIRGAGLKVKILGNGDLNRSLTVVAHKFSRSARDKITNAGGTVEDMLASTPEEQAS
ncbi:MAG: 50S ribosomal protein L15 [Sedimentisphaerales bacterium]|nr:50S ribosomal protein L15 [Sedimentisphaerales bacterium]